MKNSIIILSILLVVFITPTVFAQQEGNQLWYVIINNVKPEKIDEFEELMKELASACKEYNHPFYYYTWSSYPDIYFFLPVSDYNKSTEMMTKLWGDVIPNMDQDWNAKYRMTINGWEDFFVREIDNLSYDPEKSVEGLDYVEWWIYNYQPGTQEKFVNAFKKGIEINRMEDFEYPLLSLQSDIGMNAPAIISVFWGTNPADLHTKINKSWEDLGTEVQEMFNELNSTTRKFEKISFWYKKDLSYTSE